MTTPGAEGAKSKDVTRRNPDGTAEATKQAIESKPHPSKRIDPAANPSPQANQPPAGAGRVWQWSP